MKKLYDCQEANLKKLIGFVCDPQQCIQYTSSLHTRGFPTRLSTSQVALFDEWICVFWSVERRNWESKLNELSASNILCCLRTTHILYIIIILLSYNNNNVIIIMYIRDENGPEISINLPFEAILSGLQEEFGSLSSSFGWCELWYTGPQLEKS